MSKVAKLFGFRKNKTDNTSTDSRNQKVSSKVNTRKFDEDALLFEDGEQILDKPECQVLINKIRQTLEITPEYFDKFYMPVLVNCAHFCQTVPASASYHHSYPYGLIVHSLEVALYALRASRQFYYNCTEREAMIDELKHVYAYSVFIAAMTHDIAKTISDVRFMIRSEPNQKFVAWSPLSSYPPSSEAEIEYRLDRRKRKNGENIYNYNTHTLLGTSLLSRVVPKHGFQWLVSVHPALEIHLYHAVAGDYDNADVIGRSVREGDECSTALGKTNVSQMNNADDPLVKMRDMISQILKNPVSFGLKVNQTGFVNVVRIDNLVYVSGESLNKSMRGLFAKSGMSFPEKDHVFETMISNHFSVNSPSGDTMWWVQFTKEGQKADEGKKDIKCFVFNAEEFVPEGEIKSCDLVAHLSQKSKPAHEAEEEKLDESLDELEKMGFKKVDKNPEPQDTKETLTASSPESVSPTPNDKEQGKNAPSKPDNTSNTTSTNNKKSALQPDQKNALLALIGEGVNGDNGKAASKKAKQKTNTQQKPNSSNNSPKVERSEPPKTKTPNVVEKPEQHEQGKVANNKTEVKPTTPKPIDKPGSGDQIPKPKSVKRKGMDLGLDGLSSIGKVQKSPKKPPAKTNDERSASSTLEAPAKVSKQEAKTDATDAITAESSSTDIIGRDHPTVHSDVQPTITVMPESVPSVEVDNEESGRNHLLSMLEEEVGNIDPMELLQNSLPTPVLEETPTFDMQDGSTIDSLTRFALSKPSWASVKGVNHEDVNKHMELFAFIQQGIDSKAIRFNGNKTWLHILEHGIFIASPIAFTDESSPLFEHGKFMRTIKNSGLLAKMPNSHVGENLVSAMQTDFKGRNKRFINGHYIMTGNFFSFKYNGKPIHPSKTLCIDENTVLGNLPKSKTAALIDSLKSTAADIDD